MEELEVKLDSVVSGLDVSLELPTIIQTSGLPQDDALVFVKDCAEGKRKIAKAVRNKYETITEEESGITEYSTFEELSNKISQIPVEVPLGNAMEQNGGVLPFYDVYNELVKASKQYTEYPYCCAMELDKLDYDNDHKITLSGADAYLTSDGVYLRSSEVNGEYQFTDIDQPNTNRFVIYFFGSSPYQVPKSLPATSVFGLWCLKGTPLMNFNADFSFMNSVNVYDGELVVKEASDFRFGTIMYNQKIRLYHIKEIAGGSNIFYGNSSLREVSLPNLTTISGGNSIFYSNANLHKITLPNLTTISGGSTIFNGNSSLREVSLPNLTTISGGNSIFYSNASLREVSLPNLTTISSTSAGYLISTPANTHFSSIDLSRLKIASLGIFIGAVTPVDELKLDSLEEFNSEVNILLARVAKDEITLPKLHKCKNLISSTSKIKTLHIGDGMRDGVAGDIVVAYDTLSYLTALTVAKGFKAKLDLTGCNGLSREVLVDILNNLADLTGEASLNLIMGATLLAKLTDADKAIATQKNWTLS